MALSTTEKVVIGGVALLVGVPIIYAFGLHYQAFKNKQAALAATRATAPQTYLRQSITGVTPPVKYVAQSYLTGGK